MNKKPKAEISHHERLRSFDAATQRQGQREKKSYRISAKPDPEDRGWKREDLYIRKDKRLAH